MDLMAEIRDTELSANVPNTSFWQLLSWDGAYFGCGNELCDFKYGECGMISQSAMLLDDLFVIRYSMRCTRTGRAVPPLQLRV